MSRREQLIKSLATKEAREAFVEANLETGVSFQVRANRLRRRWSQNKLAELSGKKQPYIAKIEGPQHSLPNLQTLLDFASAFDCALSVRFVPFSEMVDSVVSLRGKDLSCPGFSEDQRLNSSTVTPSPEHIFHETTSGGVMLDQMTVYSPIRDLGHLAADLIFSRTPESTSVATEKFN